MDIIACCLSRAGCCRFIIMTMQRLLPGQSRVLSFYDGAVPDACAEQGASLLPGGAFCTAIGSAVGLRRGLTVAVVVVVVAATVTVAVVVAVTALVAGKVDAGTLPAVLFVTKSFELLMLPSKTLDASRNRCCWGRLTTFLLPMAMSSSRVDDHSLPLSGDGEAVSPKRGTTLGPHSILVRINIRSALGPGAFLPLSQTVLVYTISFCQFLSSFDESQWFAIAGAAKFPSSE
uniref:Uncharacterized protein n=1 Tax=Glossina pallidipes TaxID=7398 RepID=A0A1B0A208_GLOPL